jgi:hypothetical protein
LSTIGGRSISARPKDLLASVPDITAPLPDIVAETEVSWTALSLKVIEAVEGLVLLLLFFLHAKRRTDPPNPATNKRAWNFLLIIVEYFTGRAWAPGNRCPEKC